jgi:hypothetical protein
MGDSSLSSDESKMSLMNIIYKMKVSISKEMLPKAQTTAKKVSVKMVGMNG